MTLDVAVAVAYETGKRHIADLKHVDKPIVDRRLVSDGQPLWDCGSVHGHSATSLTVLHILYVFTGWCFCVP